MYIIYTHITCNELIHFIIEYYKIGRSIRINANERYGGVGGLRFNVISVTRRREVSLFSRKISYLTSAVV